jgi:transposase
MSSISTVRATSPAFIARNREIIVMRELEGMAYKEIADVAGVPIGTVMSRQARARKLLPQMLTTAPSSKESPRNLRRHPHPDARLQRRRTRLGKESRGRGAFRRLRLGAVLICPSVS